MRATTSPLLDFVIMTLDRPGMYYGDFAIRDVAHVMNGWRYATRFGGVAEEDQLARSLPEFHQFLETRLGLRSSPSWSECIDQRFPVPQEQLSVFVALFVEFAGTVGVAIEHVSHRRIDEGRQLLSHPPNPAVN